MKRALLTGFDPLPHALSTKGLTALVAVVVLGTGFTVQRYVESSQAAAHHAAAARFDRPSEVQAAPSERSSAGYVQSRPSGDARGDAFGDSSSAGSCVGSRGSCSGWRATAATCPRVEAASSQAKSPTLPSMFQPGDASVGG